MWKKDKILQLCGEAASHHPDWRFLKGECSFVNKKNKWLREKIVPDFRFWPQGTKHQVKVAISLPALEKHLITPLYKHKNYCDKKRFTFINPLVSMNNPYNYEERFFVNKGDVPIEEQVVAEMSRWIVAAEHCFKEDWDTTSETTIFNSAKQQWSEPFFNNYGVNLCALAASLGEFDFVDQHLTDDVIKRLGFVGDNFKALLPELKQKWHDTGSIY